MVVLAGRCSLGATSVDSRSEEKRKVRRTDCTPGRHERGWDRGDEGRERGWDRHERGWDKGAEQLHRQEGRRRQLRNNAEHFFSIKCHTANRLIAMCKSELYFQ
eukprot:1143426-Pelagomonas_calceolata.AAC.4